jgi:hypothetical protein
MTDITIQRVDGGSRPGRKPKGVTTKRVTTLDGGKVTLRTIDANSPTFGEDLLYVFARNVEAARRANKAILGTPSGVRKSR